MGFQDGVVWLHPPASTASATYCRIALLQNVGQKLWQVLAGLGLTGPLLQCLQSMYAQDSACMLTQDGCPEFFPGTAGVKQGCPASPLLFGLYLDALETYLAGQGTDLHGAPDGPVLAGQVILL